MGVVVVAATVAAATEIVAVVAVSSSTRLSTILSKMTLIKGGHTAKCEVC